MLALDFFGYQLRQEPLFSYSYIKDGVVIKAGNNKKGDSMNGMKKGILFCAIIGLVSLGFIIGKPAASAKASDIKIWNNTRHRVYVRIGYEKLSSGHADFFYLGAGESWSGGKKNSIYAITGYIYPSSGQQDLLAYKRADAYGDAKNSRNFEIKEVQGFWGNYQIYAQ